MVALDESGWEPAYEGLSASVALEMVGRPSDPQVTYALRAGGLRWNLGRLYDESASDRQAAIGELGGLWQYTEFRCSVALLPLLLVDRSVSGLRMLHETQGPWLRAALVELVLEGIEGLAKETPVLFARLLLSRLLFYDLWALCNCKQEGRSGVEAELYTDRCRRAQRAWIGALRDPAQGDLFEAWLAQWYERYPQVLARVCAQGPRAEELFPVRPRRQPVGRLRPAPSCAAGAGLGFLPPDREHEVLLALFADPANPNTLRFGQDPVDWRFGQALVRYWFLRRYDLRGASRVLNAYCRAEADRSGGELPRWLRWLPAGSRRRAEKRWPRLARAVRIALSPGMSGVHGLPHALVGALAWATLLTGMLHTAGGVEGLPLWGHLASALQSWAPVVACCFLWSCLGWALLVAAQFRAWGARVLYPHVPRLAAATAVGLAALLNIPNVQRLALSPGQPGVTARGLFLAVGALFVTYYYLHWEAASVRPPAAVERARVWRLLLVALTQALCLSLLFSWLVAGRLFDEGMGPGVPLAWPFTAWGLGAYYPALVLPFALCSLAIGVVLQTLWQEQPLTDTDVARE